MAKFCERKEDTILPFSFSVKISPFVNCSIIERRRRGETGVIRYDERWVYLDVESLFLFLLLLFLFFLTKKRAILFGNLATMRDINFLDGTKGVFRLSL